MHYQFQFNLFLQRNCRLHMVMLNFSNIFSGAFLSFSPDTSTIYQLIPTSSDETRALSLDSSKSDLVAQEVRYTKLVYPFGSQNHFQNMCHFFQTIHWFFGLSNQQYWEVKNVGSGYSQLKNYKTEKCLTGLG